MLLEVSIKPSLHGLSLRLLMKCLVIVLRRHRLRSLRRVSLLSSSRTLRQWRSMTNAANLLRNPALRIMVVGYPGTAKTGSLASLLNAGFKIRMLDYDGNIE